MARDGEAPPDPSGPRGERLEGLWQRWRQHLVPTGELLARAGELPPARLAELLLADQAERWRQGQRVTVLDYLERYPALRAYPDALQDLVIGECELRRDRGDPP